MKMLDIAMPADREVSAVTLSPSQRRAAENVMRGLERGNCVVLQDRSSDGKTTVLGHIHRQLGGAWIGVREWLLKLPAFGPAAIEEAFLDLIDEQFAQRDLVIVDDLHLVKNVAESCDYIRKYLFDAVLTAALESAAAARKKVLFASDEVPIALARR